MEIRIIGPYGGDTPQHRMTCFIFNGSVALDAGSLTRGLTLEEQRQIRHIVVSHSHMDHICALPFLVENVFGVEDEAITIHCLEEVTSNIRKNIFNNDTWPDFTAIPDKKVPSIRFQAIHRWEPFQINDLTFTPIPVDHVIPTVGFIIEDGKGKIMITSDTGPTEAFWKAANQQKGLHAIFAELSFDDSLESVAYLSKHLTPSLLKKELAKLNQKVPIYVYHMKPPYIEKIKRDVTRLGLAINYLIQDRKYHFP